MEQKTIVGYPLNGIEYNAEDAQTYFCTRTSGVYASEGHFDLGEITADRKITIGAGLAWMKISDFGGISFAVTKPVTISVEGADLNTSRTDLIVLRYDGTNQPAKCEVVCKKNSNSVDQNKIIYELALYSIEIPANSTQIIQKQHIRDLRTSSMCGVMTDGVTKIPTEHLQDAFESDVQRLIADGAAAIDSEVQSFQQQTATALEEFDADAQQSINNVDAQKSLFDEKIEDADRAIAAFNERGNLALEEFEDTIQDVAAGTDVMLQTTFNPANKQGQVAFESETMDVRTYNPSGQTGQVAFKSEVLDNVTFNPNNKSGQVAFEDETMSLAAFNPNGRTGQVAFAEDVKTVYIKAAIVEKSYSGTVNQIRVYLPSKNELMSSIVDGKIFHIRAFHGKQAGENMTQSEQSKIDNYLQYGTGSFDNLFDPVQKTVDLFFVEAKAGLSDDEQELIFGTIVDSVVRKASFTVYARGIYVATLS